MTQDSPIENRPSKPREVLKHLARYIRDRGLREGDRLPTEMELVEKLGISRASVREALRSLEAVGIIERTRRRGSFLRGMDLAPIAELTAALVLQSPEDLEELRIARLTLEQAAISLAVKQATDEDHARISEIIAAEQAQIDTDMLSNEADAAFHLSILAATHNRFLFQLGSLIQAYFDIPRGRSTAARDSDLRTVREHREIHDAIRAGDADLAINLLGRHLRPILR